MKINEIMHRGVDTIAPDAPVASIARLMRDQDIGAVPVVDEDGDLLGIITDRDITIRALADGRDVSALKARDIMTTDVVCCHETDATESVIDLMEDNQIRRLPVLDQDLRLVGMVSLGDISQRMSEHSSAEILKAVSAHHA